MNDVDWPALLERLSEPFPAECISWRAGAVSRDKKRAQALPYAEPRIYEDRLNAVCPGEWSVAFKPWGEHKLICELTIYGVSRSSTGEFDEGARNAIAQGTVAEAQAFKRACSKFGLGRYLYDIPLAWVDYDDEKKRLVETPELPSRFLPPRPAQAASERQREASQPRQPAQRQEEGEARGASSLLSAERAKAMGVELEKLGFNRREQLRLASSVLGRSVSSLEKLSETEALEVWSSAKQPARQAAPKGEALPEARASKDEPWQRWKTAEDAMLWADEWADPETGAKLFNAYRHCENAYAKAKREYQNSLAPDAKGNARDFWHYWFQKIEARKRGEEYVLPTYGSQELFDDGPIPGGPITDGATFDDLKN